MSGAAHDIGADSRRRAMLRTAMGPTIAAALADPLVIEVMVNPDGVLRLDRLGEGRVDTGVRYDPAQIERIVRLVARVEREGGMAPERFRAEDSPPEDVVAACEALSFAGLRLVLVDGADAWKADAAGALIDYLAAPNPGTCLALVASGQVTPRLHAAIADATQATGIRARRRLSIIFQRDRAGTPERGSRIVGRSCQSPRAQRWCREASTE